MKHEVWFPEKMKRQPLVEFPSSPIEQEHGDKLGSVRSVVWAFVLEIAVCLVVPLVWSLRHSFR
jgi:hypothetical protein